MSMLTATFYAYGNHLLIQPGLSPPDGPTIDTIKQHFNKMQKAYSPVKKLQNLLKATSCIHSSVSDSTHTRNGPVSVGADDFLPMLIYVLVHCGLVAAEIEADYIWDLVHQSLLNGEAGYYLTSLSSAVLVIKNFREMQETSVSQHEGRLPSISDMQGFLKLAIPDELRDSITWKTLPVRPNMTTKDVCSMIAHKFKITNLQDYGLYILVKGLEIKLGESECPQVLKVDYLSKGDECVFAFKRIAANIAWPMSMKTKS
ncbi:hypothetical protein KUTeg_013526 [Tegillarca granosa]|uniref:VPS9 domain-containing protein n=1 Tax=Tegillarca granosa TaxID=220873 RepID=A0ABQ9EYG0_TEGGR|nr:hypothetical protein KUTeg_013526 [Tegillarca granosa]